MQRRLEFAVQFDYRRPLEVRAMVSELRERMDPTAWAMLEAVSVEVCRQSALDPESAAVLIQMAAAPADRTS